MTTRINTSPDLSEEELAALRDLFPDPDFLSGYDARHIWELFDGEIVPDDTGGVGILTVERLPTSEVRRLWNSYLCNVDARFIGGEMFGNIGAVPRLMAPAYEAMEEALRGTGYTPARSTWSYNCRDIAGYPGVKSLHSAGIAIDIDPYLNPFSKGDSYSGALKQNDVNEIKKIKATKTGAPVFSWGGDWTNSKDRMHFQANLGPADLESGVTYEGSTTPPPGGEIVLTITRVQISTDSNQRHPDARIVQSLLTGFSPASPGNIDGVYGPKSESSCRAFQQEKSLLVDGIVGPNTWKALEDAE